MKIKERFADRFCDGVFTFIAVALGRATGEFVVELSKTYMFNSDWYIEMEESRKKKIDSIFNKESGTIIKS